ncbi:prealbumin-like fold domain-containing protein, partial [Streptococcus suis]
GYVYTIQVNKVNEAGESLSGAVFDVIRVRSGATVGQITTDASGKGTLGSLLNDEYILREVTPPTGYSLGEDVIVKTS